MSNIALQMSGVYKKFKRGERHDSLRDLIPALAKRAVRRVSGPLALKKEETLVSVKQRPYVPIPMFNFSGGQPFCTQYRAAKS